METTLVLVDDHDVVRQGVQAALASDNTIKVVGEASNGQEAIGVIEALQPDVALIDIRLPDVSGIDVTRTVSSLVSTKVLIYSGYDDLGFLRSALLLGINGYLLKSANIDELKMAIHRIASGRTYFQSEVVDKLLGYVDSECRSNQGITREKLTGQESRVWAQLRKGLTNREIAKTMGLSKKTVENHVGRILSKFGARSRTQAIVKSLD